MNRRTFLKGIAGAAGLVATGGVVLPDETEARRFWQGWTAQSGSRYFAQDDLSRAILLDGRFCTWDVLRIDQEIVLLGPNGLIRGQGGTRIDRHATSSPVQILGLHVPVDYITESQLVPDPPFTGRIVGQKPAPAYDGPRIPTNDCHPTYDLIGTIPAIRPMDESLAVIAKKEEERQRRHDEWIASRHAFKGIG